MRYRCDHVLDELLAIHLDRRERQHQLVTRQQRFAQRLCQLARLFDRETHQAVLMCQCRFTRVIQ